MNSNVLGCYVSPSQSHLDNNCGLLCRKVIRVIERDVEEEAKEPRHIVLVLVALSFHWFALLTCTYAVHSIGLLLVFRVKRHMRRRCWPLDLTL